MTTKQQNQVTMYEAVLRFFSEAGAPLVNIKRIGAGRDTLAALVARIAAVEKAQDHSTTGITRARKDVKAEAAQKAEILRLLITTLSSDAALLGNLSAPLSRVVKGKDAELLSYLRKIDQAVNTLAAQDLADAGYDPAVRTTLQADIKELDDTQGAARQLETSTSTATGQLEQLFAEANTVLDKTLDPLVSAQQLAQPALVTQYEAVRRVVRTAATRGAEYRGVARYGKPTLVYDRRDTGLPQPTLGNRSGKGLTLRYYTALTSTAAPAPGQGVVVKHRTDRQLADYSQLGVEEAPYLLVLLEQVDGEGRWVVR